VCDGNEIVGESQGRAPYTESVTIPTCSPCDVFMKDTYGDTWQNGTWVGFNQSYTGPTRQDKSSWISRRFYSPGCSENASASNETESQTDTVSSRVYMNGGGSKSEVRWKLLCDNNEIVGEDAGRSPYDQTITASACSRCTVYMKDTYGDTW